MWLSLSHILWLSLLVWQVSGTNWHKRVGPNGALASKRTRGNSTELFPDAVIDINNSLSLSLSLTHNSTSHHSLSFQLYLSLSFFLLYKIFFWYDCTPLKYPILSNVKSFDFDLQISRSLFSFLLSLICVSYSERVSHCVHDDGTGTVGVG